MAIEQQDPRWVEQGWGYRVQSLDELLRAMQRVALITPQLRYAWRGVSDASWRVRSSLVREMLDGGRANTLTEPAIADYERQVLESAREWGLGLDRGAPANDLELLAALQHQGLPTRLLDITWDPWVALFFACPRAEPEHDSAVLAFNTRNMRSQRTVDTSDRTLFDVQNPWRGPLRWALEISENEHTSFVLEPTYPDGRMRAQQGAFLLSAVPQNAQVTGLDGLHLPQLTALGVEPPGEERLGRLFAEKHPGSMLDAPVAPQFCALVIPPEVQMVAHAYLLEGTMSRSRRQLFPDVDGYIQASRAGEVAPWRDSPLGARPGMDGADRDEGRAAGGGARPGENSS